MTRPMSATGEFQPHEPEETTGGFTISFALASVNGSNGDVFSGSDNTLKRRDGA